MNKKGFTLVELLAVIVILAIIALIATPIIIGVVNDARKESAKRSVEGYAKALESSYYLSLMSETPATPETLDQLDVEYTGSEVKCTDKQITEDNKIKLSSCTVTGFDGTFNYENGRATEPSA